MMERKNRAKNIIIFNVNESKAKTLAERNLDDDRTVGAVFENFDINKDGFRSFRLGKYVADRAWPIKVILESEADAKNILKNRKNISIPGVRVNNDQTNMQRDYYRGVKAELQRLVESGQNNKTIKFINNKPTTVDKKDNQKNSH
ncbi:unnamed protein product [Ceutorhynchus assimilis]|uniref:Uncharacterized protein n=1 Tax=Ceutorhynchus assimilis TaxID=467358 RepID=A0A9N9QJ07_9CUCU|nr:unnamed protein product [Ceutorhynchus assimilis]